MLLISATGCTRCGKPSKVRNALSNGASGKPTAWHKAKAANALATLCNPATRSSLAFITRRWPCISHTSSLLLSIPQSLSVGGGVFNPNVLSMRPDNAMPALNSSSRLSTCTLLCPLLRKMRALAAIYSFMSE